MLMHDVEVYRGDEPVDIQGAKDVVGWIRGCVG